MSDEFTDRLERLHESRRRADQRSSENRNEGVYRAEDVEERPADAESEESSGDDSADEAADAQSTETDGGQTEAIERRSGRPGSRDGEAERSTAGRESAFDRSDRDRSEGDDNPTGEDSSGGEVSSRLKRAYRLRDKSGERTDGGRDRARGDEKPERERPERDDAPNVGRFTASKSRSDEDSTQGADGDRPPPGEHVADLRRRARDHVDAGRFQKAVPLLREILALEPRHPFALRKLADFHRREGRPEYAEQFEARLKDASPF